MKRDNLTPFPVIARLFEKAVAIALERSNKKCEKYLRLIYPSIPTFTVIPSLARSDDPDTKNLAYKK